MIRHRTNKSGQRIGSLFVNFGGPGVPGVPIVEGSWEDLDQLSSGRFDIVGWDPRGTGGSTHVRCFQNGKSAEQFWGENWTVPSTTFGIWLYVSKTFEYAQRCTALSGSLLEHISTEDTVRDLDYLRQLVGDPKLNYRGLSYGTFLGQTYVNMFPHLVQTMILDANIDPVLFTKSVEMFMAGSGTDTDVVFDQFLSLCEHAGPSTCKLAGHGDVTTRVQKVLARLRQGPISAPRVPAPHELRYGDLLVGIWLTLGQPAKWPQLADDLNQAADGDGSTSRSRFTKVEGPFKKPLYQRPPCSAPTSPSCRSARSSTGHRLCSISLPLIFLGPCKVGGSGLPAPPAKRVAQSDTSVLGTPTPKIRSSSSATDTIPGRVTQILYWLHNG